LAERAVDDRCRLRQAQDLDGGAEALEPCGDQRGGLLQADALRGDRRLAQERA